MSVRSERNSESEDGRCKPKVGFDWLVTNRLGEFGNYQRRIYILLGLPAIGYGMQALAWVFLGANVNYRCQLAGEDPSNSSYFNLPNGRSFNESFPWQSSGAGNGGRWSQCEKYEETGSGSFAELARVSCDGKYVYDDSQYKTSARIDFQLICENTVWYTVAETLFKSGVLVGVFTFGTLSDRLGRRPVFFFALCQQITFAIIIALAPNYTIFVAARFLMGMATSGQFLVAFVIVMELVGKQKRMAAGIGCHAFFAVGYVVVGMLAYLIREWRYLQLVLSLPGLFFLSYYWFMPESVRWLLLHGKKDEAIKILKKAAAENNVEIPEHELENLGEDETAQQPKGPAVGILEILSYRRTVLRSLNIFFCWFVNSGVYYGLALNSGNLGGNDYINFILSGAVEVPAYIFLLSTLNRFGRKKTLCCCMISAGVSLVACGFIPENMTWLLVTLNMLGKLFNAAAYAAIYIFAAELFPTVIRNSFMGISSVSGRVGGILSDYVILMQNLWKPLPHLIFGAVCLTSGLLSLLLPETLGKRLPETMEDGENFGTSLYDNGNTIYDDSSKSASNGLLSKKEKESGL